MTRLFRFHPFRPGARATVSLLTAGAAMIAGLATVGESAARAAEGGENPGAFENFRPFRRPERETQREAERESKGMFSGLLDGSLFQTKSNSVQAEYFLMESARLDNLIGTGTGRGASVTLSSTRGNSIFEVIGRVRLHLEQGDASIQDRASLRELPFLVVGGEALLGLVVNLLPGDFTMLQPYFGTAYKLGLNHLSLSGVPEENSDLSGSSTGIFSGTELFVGVRAATHYVVEFQLRHATGSIGGLTDAGIGGAAVSLGYRW